jgi:hypothetical protein
MCLCIFSRQRRKQRKGYCLTEQGSSVSSRPLSQSFQQAGGWTARKNPSGGLVRHDIVHNCPMLCRTSLSDGFVRHGIGPFCPIPYRTTFVRLVCPTWDRTQLSDPMSNSVCPMSCNSSDLLFDSEQKKPARRAGLRRVGQMTCSLWAGQWPAHCKQANDWLAKSRPMTCWRPAGKRLRNWSQRAHHLPPHCKQAKDLVQQTGHWPDHVDFIGSQAFIYLAAIPFMCKNPWSAW